MNAEPCHLPLTADIRDKNLFTVFEDQKPGCWIWHRPRLTLDGAGIGTNLNLFGCYGKVYAIARVSAKEAAKLNFVRPSALQIDYEPVKDNRRILSLNLKKTGTGKAACGAYEQWRGISWM